MADNFVADAGSGGSTFAADDIGSVLYPRGKVVWGADGVAGDASMANPLPIQPGTGITFAVTDNGSTLSVDDGAGSLTVDAPVGTPVFVRLSDGSAAISTLPVSVASLPTHDVTNAGTFAVQVTSLPASTNTIEVVGDAAHDAAAAGNPLLLGAYASATAPTTVSTDGDAVRLWADLSGRIQVGDGGGALTVDNGGTFAVQAAQSGTWNVGTVTTLTGITNTVTVTGAGGTFPATDSGGSLTVDAPVATPVFVRLSDGSAAISTLPVSLSSVPSHAVTNAGTFATQIDGAALTSLQLIDDAVSGAGFNISQMNGVNVTMGNGASGTGVQRVTLANDSTGVLATVSTVTTVGTLTGSGIAHDAADSGNPHKMGAKAESALSGITLVADGDRTDLYAGLDGVLIVRPHCNLEDVVQERTTNTDGASTAFASGLAAPGAGVRLWITTVSICNSSASFCTVDLRDGAAGSVLWTLPVPATGGVVQKFDPPLRLTANTALAFDASAATTTLTLSASGFKSKV